MVGLEEIPLIAVIRIRGRVGVKPDIKRTLEMLYLRRKFWATLIPLTDSYRGMLHKVKDYSTHGEVDRDTLVTLLRERGELRDGGKLSDKWLTENSEFQSVEELADALLAGRTYLHKLGWVKPYFRLRPPDGGFKRTTKRAWNDGGELGYRGKEINTLIRRMI